MVFDPTAVFVSSCINATRQARRYIVVLLVNLTRGEHHIGAEVGK